MYKYALLLIQIPFIGSACASPAFLLNKIEPLNSQPGSAGVSPRVAERALISLSVDNAVFQSLPTSMQASRLTALEDGDMYRVRVMLNGVTYTTKPMIFDSMAGSDLVLEGIGMPRRLITGQEELLALDKDYGVFYDELGRAVRRVSCGGASWVVGGFRCDIEGLGYLDGPGLGAGTLGVLVGDTAVNDGLWQGLADGERCDGGWWSAIFYSGFQVACQGQQLFDLRQWGLGIGGSQVEMLKRNY